MKLKLFYALIISASMLFAGCSESDIDDEITNDPTIEEPTPEVEEEITPTAISLSETAITLTVNDIYTLTATLTPTDAEGTITWTTSDSSVATVSSGGAIMALTAGTTNIVASCQSLSATCVVTVEEGSSDEGGDDAAGDNIFLYAFGYGPNGEEAESGVDGSETAYSMTNSAVQTNAWDTQFCIVFGEDYDSDGEVDLGIELGYTYKVAMDVKSSGEAIGLSPSINNGGDYLTTLTAWQETTSEWKEFAFTFDATDVMVGGNRFTFSIGDKISILYVDNIVITKVTEGSEGESWSELFVNGNLENDFNTLTGWTYGTECSMGYTDDGGYDNTRGYYFTNGVIRDESWQGQIQIQYDSSTIREPSSGASDSYIFTIKARADSAVTVLALESTDNSTKWTALVEDDNLEVTTEWQTFEMPFTISSGSEHIGTTQININCGQLGTTLYIDDISLARYQ